MLFRSRRRYEHMMMIDDRWNRSMIFIKLCFIKKNEAFFEKRKNAVFVTLRGKKILRNFENRPKTPYFWGFVTIPLGKGIFVKT